MLLIIEVNFFNRFKVVLGYTETVTARRIIERGYQLMKNVAQYGCLTKRYCQLKCIKWLQIILIFVEVGDVSSHYKSISL